VLRPVIAAVVAALALGGTPAAAAERPPLPLRPDGYGVAQPTPPDLVDRRLATSCCPSSPPPTWTASATCPA
jgi:hypothetical protein